MRQLQLDDFLKYRFLSELNFSPDGRLAATVVAECDAEKNEYKTAIWIRKDSAWTKLTGLGKERGYVWEDSTHILFPAARTEDEKKRAESGERFTTYYRISTEGGEAEKAFTLPFAGALKERAGEDCWIVSGAFDAECPDYCALSGEEREKADIARKENEDYRILTEIPFWWNGEGFSGGQRGGLFLFRAGTGAAERITGANLSVSDYTLLNGKICYSASEAGPVRFTKPDRIFSYDLATGKTETVSENRERLQIAALEQLDGRLVVLAEEESVYHVSREMAFYLVDPETGKIGTLRAEDESLMNSVCGDCSYGATHELRSRGDGLYYLKTVRNDVRLCRLNPDGSMTELIGEPGSIDDFDVSSDGRILVIAAYGGRLQEVYEAEAEIRKISAFNDEILKDTYVAEPRKLPFRSRDTDLDGWVLLPKDFDESKRYPGILDIHGGPRAVYGEIFFHEMQVWANRGYFVFFCNPVGGAGRGWAFADITDAYGDAEYENIMDFTDAVLARYPQIDPGRIGCTGGSYGGFMCNWILGHTDRFAAVATQRSISNWISFYGISDIGYFFVKNQLGHGPQTEEGLKRMWEMSPIRYVDKMVTPTLFIHSDEDYRCPIEQGLQLFTAMKEKGVPTRFVWFKGENHELSRSGKPLHRKKRLEEITAWMDTYLKPEETADLERGEA
ncbi:MAG: S9 family peptidase [Clostridia bacterium]|nr:S9 family peptidase [Clostridia bacterium]